MLNSRLFDNSEILNQYNIMRVYTTIALLIITGMAIGCSGSSSGASPTPKSEEQVQLSGTLPQYVGVDSNFSDTLEFVNGKVGTVDLGEGHPDWLNVKTNSNAKQVIIYGKTPAEIATHEVELSVTGDQETSSTSKFGLSFTMSVIDLE